MDENREIESLTLIIGRFFTLCGLVLLLLICTVCPVWMLIFSALLTVLLLGCDLLCRSSVAYRYDSVMKNAIGVIWLTIFILFIYSMIYFGHRYSPEHVTTPPREILILAPKLQMLPTQ